jgi:putative MFS transporter
VASCGAGAELITIGAFLTELVPKDMRGRAFAVCFGISYLAMPVLALASWLWIPQSPFGISGWRWVVAAGGSGAIVAWWLQHRLPESPHWLAMRGRMQEAEAIVQQVEDRVEHESGRPLPPVRTQAIQAPGSAPAAQSMWNQRYRSRTVMLITFNAFLSIGFFGFSQWLPTLLAAQGASISKSLWYAFVIAFAYPVSPIIGGLLADRIERKWLIVATAILFGVLITLCNTVMASNATAYQAEVFPTQIRGRALGFVHAFGRLTGIASSFMVALLLEHAGAPAVFVLISASMLIVMLSIGIFGPRTNNRSLDEIAGAGEPHANDMAPPLGTLPAGRS